MSLDSLRMATDDKEILVYILKDSSGDEINLTGASFNWAAKLKLDSTGFYISPTTGTPDADQVGNKGQFTVTVTAPSTPDVALYEVEYTPSSTLSGPITLNPGGSRLEVIQAINT